MIKHIVITVIALLSLAACTPEQIAWWKDPNVPQAQKDEVLRAMQRQSVTDCNSAIDAYWPGDKAWAKRIVWRESNNTPTARNRSGASGCFQMMLPLHNNRFYAVGCTPSQWTDPVCNTLAAANLYREAGTSPWVLTNY
jgi:hypothetical protein